MTLDNVSLDSFRKFVIAPRATTALTTEDVAFLLTGKNTLSTNYLIMGGKRTNADHFLFTPAFKEKACVRIDILSVADCLLPHFALTGKASSMRS
jgi:hypothetical protein